MIDIFDLSFLPSNLYYLLMCNYVYLTLYLFNKMFIHSSLNVQNKTTKLTNLQTILYKKYTFLLIRLTHNTKIYYLSMCYTYLNNSNETSVHSPSNIQNKTTFTTLHTTLYIIRNCLHATYEISLYKEIVICKVNDSAKTSSAPKLGHMIPTLRTRLFVCNYIKIYKIRDDK